ncbi:DUF3667 domain-containing protein [Mangrovibacterium lignilyticum]|uniref:DUF3667 domain-containing protein n=1 Tax=Mangrovibacterium lignilyticum TaxID=2668052 RepID=UPI0013D28D05|nr:DUF3667 domain-containing protein [Mangrovibacterium lignilyticum]
MPHSCKNCHNQFEGKFCNHCGQAVDTPKIGMKYIRRDIQQGLLNFDVGLLFSLKELFTRPGHSIREFIEGKRVHHYKPLSMVVILATVHSFIIHYLGMHILEVDTANVADTFAGIERATNWMENNYSISLLVTVPFFAVLSFVYFRKQGYNLAEHLVLNAFTAAQRIAVKLLFIPLDYAFPSYSLLFDRLITLISIGLYCWVFIQFFCRLRKWKVVIAGLVVYLGALLIFLLIILAVAASA